jgi:hypothetical protein
MSEREILSSLFLRTVREEFSLLLGEYHFDGPFYRV